MMLQSPLVPFEVLGKQVALEQYLLGVSFTLQTLCKSLHYHCKISLGRIPKS